MANKKKSSVPHARAPEAIPTSQNLKHIQIDTQTLAPLFDLSNAIPMIKAIQEKRNGNTLITMSYNSSQPAPSMIQPQVIAPLSEILRGLGILTNLDMFLKSNGGRAEVPWRIVTLLREYSEHLSVLLPDVALSGATHIAIAADELIMSPFSVLGSVDPTRSHPLLPKDTNGKPIAISVEDLKHCITFIKEQLGESYPDQDLAMIIAELFKYIDPLALGALEQSYNLSKLITRKCLRTRKTQLTEKHIEKIVEQLAGGYYSHSFLISRADVESDLGLPVTKADDELTQLMLNLHEYYLQQFAPTKPLPAPNLNFLARLGGIMQTSDKCFGNVQLLQKDGKPVADTWILLI